MSLLADVQAANLGWSHRLNHTGQGEADKLYFQTRGVDNAFTNGKEVTTFEFSERTINQGFLPEGVQSELRIAEGLLTETDIKRSPGLRHGSRLFRVLQPSPFPPLGEYRFWRFWVATVEKL